MHVPVRIRCVAEGMKRDKCFEQIKYLKEGKITSSAMYLITFSDSFHFTSVIVSVYTCVQELVRYFAFFLWNVSHTRENLLGGSAFR